MIPTDPEDPNRLLALGLIMALAASGKTRQDIAEAAGVSTTHVTKLVTGKVNPSQKVLVEFAKAVDYPISEIYKLGEAALEHEAESRRRREVQKAAATQTVEYFAEAATGLDRAGLELLIRRLTLRMKEIEEDLPKIA